MEPVEILLWVLYLLFEVVGEVVLDVFAAVFDILGARERDALFGAFLCFAAGAALGLISGMALPERLLPAPRTPGISLVLGPILSGLAMYTWGSFRRRRGHATSVIATFHGGAAFAFGAALGRFLLVVVAA